jgi:Tfp pilus assembly protein PilX
MRPTPTSRGPRDPERGAVLAVTLITVAGLLGLGAVTMLGVTAELRSTAQSRFDTDATYAAESGIAAGMEFLRSNCSSTQLYTAWVSAGNTAPLSPSGIVGNNLQPGVSGNPFGGGATAWYQVSILNNPEDSGFAAGTDTDGIVVLHSVGHGPDNAVAVVEAQIMNGSCVAQFCEQEYAQRGVTSRNDSQTTCSATVTSGVLRTVTPQ